MSLSKEQLWEMIDRVQSDSGQTTIEEEAIVEYILRNNLYDPDPRDRARLIRRDLGQAIRARTSKSGRGTVRLIHVVRSGRQTRLGFVDSAPLEFLQQAIGQKVDGVLADCKSIVDDRDFIEAQRGQRIGLPAAVERLAKQQPTHTQRKLALTDG